MDFIIRFASAIKGDYAVDVNQEVGLKMLSTVRKTVGHKFDAKCMQPQEVFQQQSVDVRLTEEHAIRINNQADWRPFDEHNIAVVLVPEKSLNKYVRRIIKLIGAAGETLTVKITHEIDADRLLFDWAAAGSPKSMIINNKFGGRDVPQPKVATK